jgi:predicted nucleic acid-binding protein
VGAALPETAGWLVPTIVQLELAKWLTREVGEDKADQVFAFTETCLVVVLDTPIALSAAELCARHRLATADAIIHATAHAHGADVLTCDRHFAHLPGVHFISTR